MQAIRPLLLIAVLFGLCFAAFAISDAADAEPFTVDKVTYEVNDDGEHTVTIDKSTQSSGAINIPGSVEYETVTYTVTRIASEAFKGLKLSGSLIIPDTVTYIGNSAFYQANYYPGGTELSIPSGLKYLGDSAFQGCSVDGGSLTIPGGLEYFGKCAFMDCDYFNNVTIGNGITEIPESAFRNVNIETSLSLPVSLETIGKGAFVESVMIDFTLPENLKSIGYSAFAQCGFSTLTIPDSVETIDSMAFGMCSNLENLDLGTVRTIGEKAFTNCNKLKTVTIPSTVTSIGKGTFTTYVTTVTVGSGASGIDANAFKKPFYRSDFRTEIAVTESDFSGHTYQNFSGYDENGSSATRMTMNGHVLHMLHFKVQGTIDYKATEYEVEGGTHTMPGLPEHIYGMELIGWLKSPTTYSEGDPFVMGAEDVTFTATLQIGFFSVTYDPNGGTGTIDPQSIAHDTDADLSDGTGFSKVGHGLIGWGIDPAGPKVYDLGETVRVLDPGLGLYALWEPLTYTVTYDPNGGDGSCPSASPVYGEPFAFSDGSPLSRDGYILAGWIDGSDNIYNLGQSVQSYEYGDLSLSAVWKVACILVLEGDDIVYEIDGVQVSGTEIVPEGEHTITAHSTDGSKMTVLIDGVPITDDPVYIEGDCIIGAKAIRPSVAPHELDYFWVLLVMIVVLSLAIHLGYYKK